MSSLREFIYLNDISINNHLSSMGEGVPNEVVHESTEGEETSGKAGADLSVGGIGFRGGVDRRHTDQNVLTTKLQITAPYRFQKLLDLWEERDIQLKSLNESEDLDRGDPVKFSGTMKPMSFFKFEVLTQSFTEIMDSEARESMKKLPDTDNQDWDPEESEQVEDVHTVIRTFLGSKKPVRMQFGFKGVGIPLEENHFRINSYRPFVEPREYTVIGRVQKVLEEGPNAETTWDPAELTSLMREFMPGNQADQIWDEMIEAMRQEPGPDLSISFTDEEKKITAPGLVIFPIAIFW